MEQQQITEGNKLIAEFMGFHNTKGKYYMVPNLYPSKDESTGETEWHPLDIGFDCRWDYLMPVVEKIEALGNRVQMCRRRVKIMEDTDKEWPHLFAEVKADTKIEAAWLTVVDFIEWHNQSNPKP